LYGVNCKRTTNEIQNSQSCVKATYEYKERIIQSTTLSKNKIRYPFHSFTAMLIFGCHLVLKKTFLLLKIIDRFNICNVVKPGFAARCIGKPFLAKQV
jgi:hypothetical protein